MAIRTDISDSGRVAFSYIPAPTYLRATLIRMICRARLYKGELGSNLYPEDQSSKFPLVPPPSVGFKTP